MKKYIHKIKNNFHFSKDKTERKSVSYADAQRIGILINSPGDQYNSTINQFVKKLEKDGKKVEIICSTDSKSMAGYDFNFQRISRQDMNWRGGFKTEKINRFIQKDFDYIFSINTQPCLPLESILIRSNARCRIGCDYGKSNLKNLDLLIKLKEDDAFELLLEQMNSYTKLLETHAEQQV